MLILPRILEEKNTYRNLDIYPFFHASDMPVLICKDNGVQYLCTIQESRYCFAESSIYVGTDYIYIRLAIDHTVRVLNYAS